MTFPLTNLSLALAATAPTSVFQVYVLIPLLDLETDQQVSKYAFFLKDIRDAQMIRTRVLARLEQAVHPDTTPEERAKILQFSIVGGGPTGVEFAAELHDFINGDVYRIMPELKGQVKIRVYDVAPELLINFDKCVIGQEL